MFAGTFAPVGWELCHGQPMAIAENDALFTLIGTIYGGDGESTFHLPDLRGRAPVHVGQGPGIAQPSQVGDQFGVEEVTLTVSQVPPHRHDLLARTAGGKSSSPAGNVLASPPGVAMYVRTAPDTALDPWMVGAAGGSLPHDNRMPYLTINFIISLFGEFPQWS